MISSIDKIDYQILKRLIEDGRTSYRAIADETDLTDVAIKKRVDALKRKGIISSISANLDLSVIGFEKPVFLQIRTDLSKHKDVMKKLESLEHVNEVYQVMGEYNLLLKAVLPDSPSTKEFLDRLASIDGVLDMKSMVVLEKVKSSNSLPSTVLQKRL
ncbi:MAG: Lrp/AsnC family transcriptional regulator [Candidatus Diapherotrites archaeon]